MHHYLIEKNNSKVFEASKKNNIMFGFTGNYIKTETIYNKALVGNIKRVKLKSISKSGNMSVE